MSARDAWCLSLQVVRQQPYGFAKFCNGRLLVSIFHQSHAQLRSGADIVRLEPTHFAEFCDGLVRLIQIEVHVREGLKNVRPIWSDC